MIQWTRIDEKTNTVPKDLGTVVIVLHRVLHEAETVDITHIGVSIGSEEIEATNSLLQWEERTTHFFHGCWDCNFIGNAASQRRNQTLSRQCLCSPWMLGRPYGPPVSPWLRAWQGSGPPSPHCLSPPSRPEQGTSGPQHERSLAPQCTPEVTWNSDNHQTSSRLFYISALTKIIIVQ